MEGEEADALWTDLHVNKVDERCRMKMSLEREKTNRIHDFSPLPLLNLNDDQGLLPLLIFLNPRSPFPLA